MMDVIASAFLELAIGDGRADAANRAVHVT
jgi:hypothetical protein